MSDPLPRNAATIDLSSQQNLRASVTYLNEDEDALPAGARVVEPALDSTQAVRGSLFAIVEFSPESAGTPTLGEYDALSDKLLSTLQRSYYTLRGSQSAVLAEAMRNAQNVVQEYNAAHPKGTVRVSVACATLLKRRLMIACTGAAFMILRNGERVELYPTSPGSLRPAAPDDPRSYEVLRWDLSPGDVVLLAGAGWSDRIALRTLAATVYYLEEGMAGEAAKGLQEQSGGVNAPGILLEIAGEPEAAARAANPLLANLGPRPAQSGPTPTSAAAVAVATLPSAPLPAAAVRPTAPTPAATIAPLDLSQANPLYAAKKSTALPTAMAATPPVDLTPDPSPEERGEDISPLSRGEDYSPLSSGEGPGVRSTDAPDHQITETPITFPNPTITVVPDISEKTRPIPVATVVAAAAASNPDTNTPPTGMEKARTFFRNMLPEKRADVPEGFALIDSDENARPYSEATQQSWSPAATVPVADAPNFQESAPPVFTPPAPATGSRARLIISIALIIALLIPIGVGAFAWRLQGGIRAEAQQLIEMAAARTLGASDALDREDKRAALNMLSEGEDLLDRAEELVGPSAPMADLRDEMRRLEMDAAQVDPLYQLTTPLVTFPSGSAASRVLVGDQEIYVLDPGRGVVDRYRMDSTLESVPDQSGIPVIRTGDTIAGTTVGPLLDMAWLPIVPGYDDRATLVVLDANNHFFRYDPRVEGAMLLTPGAASTLESVRQMEVFQGRLYLADVGLQQVLRYGAGQYGGTPDPWFGQATNLDEMESMQIDGDIWMLVKNGQVLRFNQGRQLPYSLDGSVGLVRQAVDFFVGDGTNPFIFVVDKAGERIWVYNKETGEYVKQFAAPEGNPLAGLSSLYIEGVKSMYLLTNSALYKHPFPQDAPVNP